MKVESKEALFNVIGSWKGVANCLFETCENNDAKIKAKWCDEIMEFIKKNEYCVGDYNIENHYAIATDILKQKLNEMKGE